MSAPEPVTLDEAFAELDEEIAHRRRIVAAWLRSQGLPLVSINKALAEFDHLTAERTERSRQECEDALDRLESPLH